MLVNHQQSAAFRLNWVRNHSKACNIELTHHVPVGDNLRLLSSPVPHGGHQQKRWLAYSFEDSQKCPDSDERWEAEAERMAAKHCAPCQDVETQILSDRYALENPIGGVLDDQHGKINTCREPAELVVVSVY